MKLWSMKNRELMPLPGNWCFSAGQHHEISSQAMITERSGYAHKDIYGRVINQSLCDRSSDTQWAGVWAYRLEQGIQSEWLAWTAGFGAERMSMEFPAQINPSSLGTQPPASLQLEWWTHMHWNVFTCALSSTVPVILSTETVTLDYILWTVVFHANCYVSVCCSGLSCLRSTNKFHVIQTDCCYCWFCCCTTTKNVSKIYKIVWIKNKINTRQLLEKQNCFRKKRECFQRKYLKVIFLIPQDKCKPLSFVSSSLSTTTTKSQLENRNIRNFIEFFFF